VLPSFLLASAKRSQKDWELLGLTNSRINETELAFAGFSVFDVPIYTTK
jgi:hypothetical protein